jgi:hypothetical protein
MKRKWLFAIIAAALLIPWPVVYAYDSAQASTNAVTVIAADATEAPHLNAYGHAIGGIQAGELFHVDATATLIDTQYALCITNVDQMVPCFRYMNMVIGIYVQSADGNWQKVTTAGGIVPDVCLTMQTGVVNFTLPGNAVYKITIDSGCFYCYGANANGTVIIPEFNLTTG